MGNLTYQVRLNSPTPLSDSPGVGTNRASLGPVPQPFDLGTILCGIGVCLIDCSLDGFTLFLQVPAVGGTNPIDVSNAFSIGIGH